MEVMRFAQGDKPAKLAGRQLGMQMICWVLPVRADLTPPAPAPRLQGYLRNDEVKFTNKRAKKQIYLRFSEREDSELARLSTYGAQELL